MAAAAADGVVIGLIGDIQYADRREDEGRGRYYRASLECVKRATAAFNASGVAAVVTLGDMIDGYCADGGNYAASQTWTRQSEDCLRRVLDELEQLRMPRHDVLGNHELFNFEYDRLDLTGLNLGDAGRAYYVRTYGNWDLIVLNTFEHFINEFHRDHRTACFEKSLEFFRRYRPDADDAVLGPRWNVKGDGSRLDASERHLTPLNGGTSDDQRAWLRRTLRATRAAGRGAIVFSHAPLFGKRVAACLAWDHAEVLAILHEFRETVHAVISGHFHKGGYERDEAGIHHAVLHSPLEVTPDRDCWAFLELRDGSARLRCTGPGVNGTPDCELHLAKPVEESLTQEAEAPGDLFLCSCGRPTFDGNPGWCCQDHATSTPAWVQMCHCGRATVTWAGGEGYRFCCLDHAAERPGWGTAG